ncbi:MAG: SRPBCC family protein [Planctomycetes bacterium]|nr:SRPBCC family protein [Planctomycetota bacterium]
MRLPNVLKVVLASVLLFVLVVFGIGQILSDRWLVETVRRLDGPATRLAPLLQDLRAWSSWGDLMVELGAPTQREASGEAGQAGQALRWRGPLGEARLVLTEVEPLLVGYRWTMQRSGEEQAQELSAGRIEWLADGEQTVVTWREWRQMTSLAERWFAWFGAKQERIREIQRSGLEGLQLQFKPK